METSQYSKHYSAGKFISLMHRVGQEVPFAEDVLAMFYCLRDPYTPGWIKALIVGALGYFIFPFDAVPDMIPVAGWLDDAGVITSVIVVIKSHIKPAHRRKARAFLE